MSEEKSYSWRSNDGIRIRVSVEPSYIYSNVCRFAAEPALYPGGALHVPSAESEKTVVLAARPEDFWNRGNFRPSHRGRLRHRHDGTARRLGRGRRRDRPGDPRTDRIGRRFRVAGSQEIPARTGRRYAPRCRRSSTKPSPPPSPATAEASLCSMSATTTSISNSAAGVRDAGCRTSRLKYGVERLIREHVPEVGEILDTTDHAGGKNPYYQPAPGR